jgi:TolB-like protein
MEHRALELILPFEPALPDRRLILARLWSTMTPRARQQLAKRLAHLLRSVVEEIITALSPIRWIFVITRNSSFTYKGKAVDVTQVGRELGVRYVLEGSVRRAARRVRITAQLIDTTTRTHLDGSLEDVFERPQLFFHKLRN